MAQNAQSNQDDLSDITGGPISPWLVMAAQKEVSQGTPGQATAQLGHAATARAQVLKNQQAAVAPSLMPGGKPMPLRPSGNFPQSGTPMPPPVGQSAPAQASPPSNAPPPAAAAPMTEGQQQMSDLGKDAMAGVQIDPKTGKPLLGSKAEEKTTDTDAAKRLVSMRQGYDPYQIQLQQAIQMGYKPPVSGYQPLRDVNGIPILDPKTGKPEEDTTQPIYDLNNLGKADPNSPFQMSLAGQKKLQDMIDNRPGPQARPADLTGLMMAADYLNKTNTFGQNYRGQQQGAEQAREDQEKLAQQKFMDQEGVQKNQNDLYKDVLSGAATGLNGGNVLQQLANSQALQQMAGFGGSGQHLPPTEQVQNAKLYQMYSRDPAVQKSDTALSAAHQMQNLLQQNTSPAVLMAKIQALRSSGLQRITNFEVSEFGGDQRATEQANQALEKLAYGDLSKMNSAEIGQAAKVLEASAQQVSAQKRNDYRNLGMNMGATPEYVTQTFGEQPAGVPIPKSSGHSGATNIPAPKASQHSVPSVSMTGAGAQVAAQQWAKAHLNDSTPARDGQPNSVHAAAILKGQ